MPWGNPLLGFGFRRRAIHPSATPKSHAHRRRQSVTTGPQISYKRGWCGCRRQRNPRRCQIEDRSASLAAMFSILSIARASLVALCTTIECVGRSLCAVQNDEAAKRRDHDTRNLSQVHRGATSSLTISPRT